jgi:hypothetical protein
MRNLTPLALGAALCLAAAAAAGCAPAGMYDWGSYESSVLHLYTDPSPKQRDEDRRKLIDEVRKTELKGKQRVPPGKYAQIGYLCWLNGDTAAARQYFQAERDAYPESAKLMDSLLGRLQ